MTNWIRLLNRMITGEAAQQTSWTWVDRQNAYDIWSAYYSNSIYDPISDGGQRENINAILGNAAAADLAGMYNPVGAVVDLYLNVFGGAFGEQITIVPEGVATVALSDAIAKIWRWSNLTIEKQPLCRLAAMHGTVGLRIVAKDGPRPRVYLKVEHPKIIRDFEADDRGNITAVQLEYEETTGLGEDAKTTIVREELTKTEFRIYDATTGKPLLTDRTPNALGVVPYVIIRHEHLGETWGRNSFYRAHTPIDRLNALITHVNTQIHRHVRAKWFIAADGAAPESFDLSDMTVAFSRLSNGATAPVMLPMVAPLNLADAIAQSQMLIGIIEDLLPELKATQGKFLSGQSGETIAMLRKPAEDRVLLARSLYEDALVRAQQIAVSWMVLLGMADIGTGRDAQRAYDEGFEDHHFQERPVFEKPEEKPAEVAPVADAFGGEKAPADPKLNGMPMMEEAMR